MKNSSRLTIFSIIFIACLSHLTGCSAMSQESTPTIVDCPKERLQSRRIGSVPQKSQWQICERDEDCVIVPGVCELSAANKIYAIDSACHARKMATLAKCAPSTRKNHPTAECNSGSCAANY